MKNLFGCREKLGKPFHEALATYLHEIDHRHGSDQSAEFSYALTDTLGVVIGEVTRQPELYRELERRWCELNKDPKD